MANNHVPADALPTNSNYRNRTIAASKSRAEALAIVYVQDVEFFRYIDSLKWSRFQTASAIEAAALYALFEVETLSQYERVALVGFVTLIVLLLGGLARADENRSRAHLNRIRDFENKQANRPYERIGAVNAGGRLMRRALWLLIVLNLFLIIRFAVPLLHRSV